MEYLIALAGIAVLTLLLLVTSGCSPSAKPDRPVAPQPVAVAHTVTDLKTLDRTAVRALLKELADSPAPEPLLLGAMCYDMAGPPDSTDYICPKCGERTLYAKEMVEVVESELPYCRRQYAELRKLTGEAIAYDESQFCRKCRPEVKIPKAVLTLKYNDGQSNTIVAPTREDIRILRELLDGERIDHEDDDATTPLKDKLPRLKQLLGESPK